MQFYRQRYPNASRGETMGDGLLRSVVSSAPQVLGYGLPLLQAKSDYYEETFGAEGAYDILINSPKVRGGMSEQFTRETQFLKRRSPRSAHRLLRSSSAIPPRTT